MQPTFLFPPQNQGNNFMNFPNGVDNQQGRGGDQLSGQFSNIDLNSSHDTTNTFSHASNIQPPFDPMKYVNASSTSMSNTGSTNTYSSPPLKPPGLGGFISNGPPLTSSNPLLMASAPSSLPNIQPQPFQKNTNDNGPQNNSRPPSVSQQQFRPPSQPGGPGGIIPPTSNYGTSSISAGLPPGTRQSMQNHSSSDQNQSNNFSSGSAAPPPARSFNQNSVLSKPAGGFGGVQDTLRSSPSQQKTPVSDFQPISTNSFNSAQPNVSQFGHHNLKETQNNNDTGSHISFSQNTFLMGGKAPPTSSTPSTFSSGSTISSQQNSFGNIEIPKSTDPVQKVSDREISSSGGQPTSLGLQSSSTSTPPSTFKPSLGGPFQPVKSNDNFSSSFAKPPAPLNQPSFPPAASSLPQPSTDQFQSSFSRENESFAGSPQESSDKDLGKSNSIPLTNSSFESLPPSNQNFGAPQKNQGQSENVGTSFPNSGPPLINSPTNYSGPQSFGPPPSFNSPRNEDSKPSSNEQTQQSFLQQTVGSPPSSFPQSNAQPQPRMPGMHGPPPSRPQGMNQARPPSSFPGSQFSSFPEGNQASSFPAASTAGQPPYSSGQPPNSLRQPTYPMGQPLSGPPSAGENFYSGPPSNFNRPPLPGVGQNVPPGPPNHISNRPPPMSSSNGPHGGPPLGQNGPPLSFSSPTQGIHGRPSYLSQKYPQSQYAQSPQQTMPPPQQQQDFPRTASQPPLYGGNAPLQGSQSQFPPGPPQPGIPPQVGSFPPPTQQGFQSPAYQATGQPPPLGGYPGDGQMQYPNTRPQPQGPAKKLDPDTMPSRVQVMQDDRDARSGIFKTDQRGGMPPLVTTPFSVHDCGNSSPRFVRSTMYAVPTTSDLMKQVGVPFGLVISPFARVAEGEQDPPMIDYSQNDGPVRCIRCKAYMNPFMQFIDGGRRFQCTFCRATNDVPADYFQHLDHLGQRADKHQRPELCLGSYEFLVPNLYCRDSKFPNPPALVFILDVSYNTIKSGLIDLLCAQMMSILNEITNEKLRVGFITYANSVQFYNIKASGGGITTKPGTMPSSSAFSSSPFKPEMMEVTDVDDMFMPLLDGFLATPAEAAVAIQSIMDQIPIMFRNTKETETILLPAILAGMEALKANETVGKLLVFHSSLPIYEAPGKLVNRDDRKMLGSDKEKTVLSPQSTVYNNLAQDCVNNGVCVDIFVFNNSYVDLATIGQVCRLTGGEIFKYTYFQANIDGERLVNDLRRNITRPIAFDAVMRVRTSTGVRPTDFYGHFFMSNVSDMEIAAIDCDKSVALEIKHDDKLVPEEGVLIQVALLYTSSEGVRKLRVHNLSFQCTSQMQEIYRYCELDTLINYLSKQCAFKLLENSPKTIKDALISKTATILATYRKHCASPGSSIGQLILPECLKLLPLYVNSLIKCDAISGGPEIAVDDRSFAIYCTQIMDIPTSVVYFYPHLISLHDVDPDADDLPVQMRCSFEKFRPEGVYLLDNTIYMFLWIGFNVDTTWVQNVFGVPNVAQIDTDLVSSQFPQLDNPLSRRVNDIIDYIRSTRPRSMRLTVVRQKDKLEMVLRQFLIEDRGLNDSQLSYVDFLCHIHKEIRQQLS